jgi:nucleoside-diphosphate-sugar epimerase
MGASIFDVTLQYDNLAINYIQKHSECRYIFLSSGAVYGSNFEQPVDSNSRTIIPINYLQPQDWYGIAKMYAECRHRALPHLSIVDIRIFNYFSHTLDVSARFFITDIIRAIQENVTFITTSENIVRDYIGPDDFFSLVSVILKSPATNDVLDCYTRAPLDKMTLLSSMQELFGLKYKIQESSVGINATGVKINYYSQNFRASKYGYSPKFSSLASLKSELEQMSMGAP